MSVISKKVDQGVCSLTLERSEALNALNKDIMNELDGHLAEIETNAKEYKGLIITGSGPKAFAAGADISEFDGLSEIQGRGMAENGAAIFDRIEQLPIVTIAAVNGFALGGGCELAMACHLRLASSNARFGQPEVNLGLIPGYGGTQRLIRYIGRGKALELMMTGDMIDALEAQRLGLVNRVLELDQLLPEAIQLVLKIAAKGPLAVAQVIRCVNAYFEPTIGAFSIEADRFGNLIASADAQEGVHAFLSKRKAEFKGL